MRVLVTGGAGYIGSIVVQEMLQAGHDVCVLDNLSQGHREAVRGAELIVGDIADTARVKSLLRDRRIEAVAHLAAATVVSRSYEEPRVFFEENTVKGLALVHAMLDCGVRRLVFSSTASVFGEPQYVPIDEQHPLSPMSPYGESKLAFERALGFYCNAYDFSSITFRYFNAAGALPGIGEHHDPETHIIPAIFQAATIEGRPFPVYGNDYPTPDGACIRDYVHVVDLARAHVLALANIDRLKFGRFNLGSQKGISVLQLIREAECVTGRPIPTVVMPRRIGDPSVLIASSEAAKQDLLWSPELSNLRAILESAWNWFQTNPNGYANSQ